MRSLLIILLLLTATSCTSISIPNYIQDKHPTQKTFYAPYASVHEAAVKALTDSGWAIAAESDPALYERQIETPDANRPKTVIFTEVRQLSFFVGSGYSRLNVFLNVVEEKATEVEVRFVKVTNVGAKTFYNYENESLVEGLLKRIEENLK